jgi:hypothetical protein
LVAVWVESIADLTSTNSIQEHAGTLSTSLRIWQLGVELPERRGQRLALPGRSGPWSAAFRLLERPGRLG